MFVSFFSTVLSGTVVGVLVSVLSQLLLKGIFDPAQQLKSKIAQVGIQLELLSTQYSFIDNNYGITRNYIDLISRLSAGMYSLPYQIPVYSKIRCLFKLPSREKIKKAYDRITELSYELRNIESFIEPESGREISPALLEHYQEFREKLKNKSVEKTNQLIPEIRELLGIRQPYPSLPSPSKTFQASR